MEDPKRSDEVDVVTAKPTPVASPLASVDALPEVKKRSAEDALVDQTHAPMSTRKILITFCALQSILLIAFVDQTSVTTVLPRISDDLGAADRIGWVGTAFLIATLSSQLAISRLSDILGRKPVLLGSTATFAFGNVLCGFARSPVWLFASRGVSGLGAGGIISLTMVIVSDLVPLKERGKYQGFTGVTVALGSGIGPLIGGALATSASWRWAFWFTPPICAALAPVVYIMVPQHPIHGSAKTKLKQIDYVGIFLAFGLSVLLVVPLSGGGSIYSWKSPLVIAMIVVGVALLVLFVFVESKVPIPIMPLRMFQTRAVTLILLGTFTQGIVYYGLLFYLPTYFQESLGHSAVSSGVLILPFVLSQPFTIALCGQITSRTGIVIPLLQLGYAGMVFSLGLMYRFSTSTSTGYIVGILILVGLFVGMTLQTSLVAAQAAAPERDRAAITGARNTARSFGGALGLAMCGAVRNNVVAQKLAAVPGIDSSTAAKVVTYGVSAVEDQLSPALLAEVRAAVMGGIKDVFLSFIPAIGVSFIACCFLPNVVIGDAPRREDVKLEKVKPVEV